MNKKISVLNLGWIIKKIAGRGKPFKGKEKTEIWRLYFPHELIRQVSILSYL
jgi:hypothetical protein